MNVEIIAAGITDKPILQNLLQLYLHDLNEFEGNEIGQDGLYAYPYLDAYWVESERYPFLLKVSGEITGFVLVRRLDVDTHSIAEFFILRSYRRRGIGEYVARQMFVRFPGKWRVSQISGNYLAQKFWRKVIGEVTGGNYQEFVEPKWNDIVQVFET